MLLNKTLNPVPTQPSLAPPESQLYETQSLSSAHSRNHSAASERPERTDYSSRVSKLKEDMASLKRKFNRNY